FMFILRQVRITPMISVGGAACPEVAPGVPGAGGDAPGGDAPGGFIPLSFRGEGPGEEEPGPLKWRASSGLKPVGVNTGATGVAEVIGTNFSIQMPVLALSAVSWLPSTSKRIWRNWLSTFAQ